MKSPNSPCSNLVVAYFLEHIQEQGNSTYIAEGELRASHRLLREAPYEDFGLPGNNDFQTELQPIPAYRPIELVFALRPTAWQFAKGVRVTIAFADVRGFTHYSICLKK